eukprot:COSAG02_NODE_75_length_41389_cov_106.665762_42_plen_1040_part_00
MEGEDEDLAAAIALSLAMAGDAGDEVSEATEHGAAADEDEDAEAVAQFLAFTGTSDGGAARAALTRASGDVEVAVGRFFEGGTTEGTLSERTNRAHRMLDTGDARGALSEWLVCLALARAQANRQGEGALLGSLSSACHRLGEYRKAIDYLEQARAIFVEIGDRKSLGSALGNLGGAYYRQGEYRKAIDYLEQARAISVEIGDRQGLGSDLGNIGSAYYSLGEYRKAIDYHEQARAIAVEIGDRQGLGSRLGNIGNAYSSLGEYRKAIDYLEQARAISVEIGDRQVQGNALGNIGNAYSSLGEYRKAIDYLEQARAIFVEIGDRQGLGSRLGNLANAHAHLGQHEEAVQHYTAAVQVFKDIRADAPEHEHGNPDATGPSGDALQISVFEQQSFAHHGLVRSLVALGRTTDALFAAEDGRSLALKKLLGVDEFEQEWGAAKLLALAAEPEVIADLVYYHHDTADEKLWTWVVPRCGSGDIQFVEQDNVAAADVPEVAAAIGVATREGQGPRAVAAMSAATDLSKLYKLLIDPIVDKLSQDGRVVFFPHERFVLTPFSALRCPKASTSAATGDTAAAVGSSSPSAARAVVHLLDQHTVHVGVSLRGLEASVRQRKTKGVDHDTAVNSSLVVGFPRVNVDTADGRTFDALPGAITEARTVSRALGCKAMVGDSEATRPKRATVLERLACSAGVIHLATHGVSCEVEGARLLLDGEARQSTAECGEWLMPEDIMARRPLRAQLAVLSACHSGSGQMAAGEGVVGFARALLGAGVLTVVVALWALPDAEQASLMGRFYDRLTSSCASVDVGEAMREAMRETRTDMVSQERGVSGVSEGYWGGLMVLGCGSVSLGGTCELAEGVPPEPEPEPVVEAETGLQPASTPQTTVRVKSGVVVYTVREFLIEARLSRYTDELVTHGGLQLADVHAVKDDDLLRLGVTKEFHRRRFLREARQVEILQPELESEVALEPSLEMDFAAWLALHGASQYEAAFREELEGSGTLADVTIVITEQADLAELVGVTDVEDARVLWEAIECARARQPA